MFQALQSHDRICCWEFPDLLGVMRVRARLCVFSCLSVCLFVCDCRFVCILNLLPVGPKRQRRKVAAPLGKDIVDSRCRDAVLGVKAHTRCSLLLEAPAEVTRATKRATDKLQYPSHVQVRSIKLGLAGIRKAASGAKPSGSGQSGMWVEAQFHRAKIRRLSGSPVTACSAAVFSTVVSLLALGASCFPPVAQDVRSLCFCRATHYRIVYLAVLGTCPHTRADNMVTEVHLYVLLPFTQPSTQALQCLPCWI